MVVLDTNTLIRFFTKDDLIKAEKVKKLIESDEELYVPDVVFPEIEYVLLSFSYNSSRQKVLMAFKFLASKNNIYVSKHVKNAIEIYENSFLDMADCIIASSSKGNLLASFDRDLLLLKGVKVYW